MTLGEPITPSGSARTQIAAFLRPRWRSLTVVTALTGILAICAGGAAHWLFAEFVSADWRATGRWIGWTWLALAMPWWAVAILRAWRPSRRATVAVAVAVVLAVCVGWPAGTWWTYLVNHAAGRGQQFDSAAANEFFLSAFSQYRRDLGQEGQMQILESVQRKRRDAVMDRVRAVRAVLDAPVPGETPPPGQDWNRTRYDLAMSRQLSSRDGTITYEVFAEQTYPIDRWPWQGNARSSGRPWTFTVRQDDDGGWWLVDFTHPDICAAYRHGYGCQVTDPSQRPPRPTVEPSPSPSPSGSGFRNWEFLPCGPRDPLREFHNCPTPQSQ